MNTQLYLIGLIFTFFVIILFSRKRNKTDLATILNSVEKDSFSRIVLLILLIFWPMTLSYILGYYFLEVVFSKLDSLEKRVKEFIKGK